MRRLGPGIAALALVLVIHGWLLNGLGSIAGNNAGGSRPGTLSRPLILTMPVPPLEAAPAQLARQAAFPAVEPSAPLAPEPVPPVDASLAPAEAPLPVDLPIADGGGAAPPVPTYATQMPPATTRQFEFRRGAVTGDATWQWLPGADGGYRLSLDGAVFDRPLITWTSQGRIDEFGLAPDRFVAARGRRGARAANFQREAGKITFSGPTIEWPLAPGAQDRLSWWVQLPAILAANPGLREAGSEIVLFVVGAEGDAARWSFTVGALESTDVPAGRVDNALYLRRRAQGPYDVEVEVWLDPGQHHLPIRVRLGRPDTGDFTEYSWK